MAKVDGLEKLKRRFAKMPPKVRAAARKAIDQGADELVAMQRRLVPVDQGDLKNSIRKEDGRHDLSVEVKGGDAKTFYARFQEFGTVDRPAQPFFFPAYRVLRRRIRGRISRAVSKAVKTL